MSDQDVNIIGVNGANPPMWATEQTLEDMLGKIEDLVKITEGQRRELKKGIGGSSSGSGGKNHEKAQKKATNLLGALSSGLKDSAKSAADSAAGFDNLPGPLAKFGKELKNTSGATKMAAIGLGIIGNQIGKAIATTKESVNTLRDLSDSGIRLEGGMLEVQRGLAQTGMTLADFGETASKYAQVIAQKGWSSVSNLASVVNESAGGFKKWGMTTAEGIDITAEYLDQQRRVGMFQAMDQAKQSNLLQETMDRLTAYSKVLNVSRKDMLDARRDMKTSRDVQAQLALMDEASRTKANEGLDALSDSISLFGPDLAFLGEAATDLAGNKIAMLSQTFQDMAQGGGADAVMALSEMVDGAKAGMKPTKEMIREWVLTFGSNKELMQNLINAGGQAKEFGTNLSIAYKTMQEAGAQEGRLRERGGKEFQESVDGNVQTLTGFEDMLQKVQASFEYKRMETFLELLGGTGTDAVELATKGLQLLHEKIMAFNNDGQVAKFRQMVIDNPIIAMGSLVTAFVAVKAASWAVAASMTKMGPGMLKFATGMGWLGGAAAAGAAGYAVGTGLNALPTLFGADSISTNIGDLVDRIKGTHAGGRNDPMRMANTAQGRMDQLSPDQQAVLKKARENQARAKQKAAENASTTSSSATTTPTDPGMTQAEIAQLSGQDQTNYYLSELLKSNKKMGKAITGDLM